MKGLTENTLEIIFTVIMLIMSLTNSGIYFAEGTWILGIIWACTSIIWGGTLFNLGRTRQLIKEKQELLRQIEKREQ